MAASREITNAKKKGVESKQLLYPDVFGQSYQEDRLRIVGKSNPKECLQTYSIPQSSVLSQIKSFLPHLSNANLKLAEDIEKNPQKADEVNIECIDEDSKGKHIEMNLSMIPTVGLETSDESESDSCDNDIDDVEDNDNPNDNIDNNDNANLNQKCQVSKRQSKVRNIKSKKQTHLMELKLPSNGSRKKHKACIEVIDSSSSSCQEELAKG